MLFLLRRFCNLSSNFQGTRIRFIVGSLIFSHFGMIGRQAIIAFEYLLSHES